MPILKHRLLRIVPLLGALYDTKEDFVNDLRWTYYFYYYDEEETIDEVSEVILFDLLTEELGVEVVLVRKGGTFEEIRTLRDLIRVLDKASLSAIFSGEPPEYLKGVWVLYFDEKQIQELFNLVIDVFVRDYTEAEKEEREDIDPVDMFDATYEFLVDGIVEFIKKSPVVRSISALWERIGVVWKYKGKYTYVKGIFDMFEKLKEMIYREAVSRI